jgi:hypothetical protein
VKEVPKVPGDWNSGILECWDSGMMEEKSGLTALRSTALKVKATPHHENTKGERSKE